MLINLRNALMSGKRLPYDAEVEYVTNLSGRATITTDIYHNTANKVEFGVMLPPASGGQYLGTFRAYSNEQTATTRVIRNGTNTGSILVNHGTIAGGGGTTMSVANADTVLWGWTKAGEANINGVSATLSQPAVQTLSVPFEFFYTQTAGRIYHFKVENQCDLIPVRKNGAGYLYDRMSGKMYSPDSGVLSYGQDVVPVEYIESHGTEYIDTGITSGPSNLEFTIDCTITNTIGTSEPFWTGSGVNSSGGLHYVLEQRGIRTGGGSVTNSIPYTSGSRVNIRTWYDSDAKRNVTIGSQTYYGAAYSAASAKLYLLKMYNLANQQGKTYGATVTQNGTLVRSMLPVRVGTDSTSWEGAMMDVLTRRIYRNAGTGAFLYGNDV